MCKLHLLQNMCKLLPYLIYAQYVCYLCTEHVLLAHIHATGMLHKCLLHVCILLQCCIHAACNMCKLLVSLICAACIHAYYYIAAYMPLVHMQAISVPHKMCSLHTCILLQCFSPRMPKTLQTGKNNWRSFLVATILIKS